MPGCYLRPPVLDSLLLLVCMRCFALELCKCVRNTEGTRQELRLHLDWGGAALKLSGGSTGLTNELSGRGEVKGRNKEELRKIELEKVKMEREGRGMEGSPRQSS